MRGEKTRSWEGEGGRSRCVPLLLVLAGAGPAEPDGMAADDYEVGGGVGVVVGCAVLQRLRAHAAGRERERTEISRPTK